MKIRFDLHTGVKQIEMAHQRYQQQDEQQEEKRAWDRSLKDYLSHDSVYSGNNNSDHDPNPRNNSNNNNSTTTNNNNMILHDDSNIRDVNRRIVVVTTAALPWRTGTAVNPLLRALYLTRGGRPKHHVTLMIPWLDTEESRIRLYGPDNNFQTPREQERWIRHYCRTRANCTDEEKNLRIRFYLASYHEAFGSIFPSVDVCALIPRHEADIAIPEEPEHLNWFRVPNPVQPQQQIMTQQQEQQQEQEEQEEQQSPLPTPKIYHPSDNNNDNKNKSLQETSELQEQQQYAEETKEDETFQQPKEETPKEENQLVVSTAASTTTTKQQFSETEELGWAHKFRHVVGILHTNYSAYVEQYGMFSTSFFTGRAINALSSLVVRAYCHKIIRLSNTLPSLAPRKEITSNIHGVRQEFLVVQPPPQEKEKEEEKTRQQTQRNGATSNGDGGSGIAAAAPVYFIGKLMWAKGFDQVLELQELHRQKTNHYFPIDIYGTGPDHVPIQRAFHGRPDDDNSNQTTTGRVNICTTDDDGDINNNNVSVEVFRWEDSLRSCLTPRSSSSPHNNNNNNNTAAATTTNNDNAAATGNENRTTEVVEENGNTTHGVSPIHNNGNNDNMEQREDLNAFVNTNSSSNQKLVSLENNNNNNNIIGNEGVDVNDNNDSNNNYNNDRRTNDNQSHGCSGPISILGDMSSRTLNTGFATTRATLRLAEKAVQTGVKMTFSTHFSSSSSNCSNSSSISSSSGGGGDVTAGDEENHDDGSLSSFHSSQYSFSSLLFRTCNSCLSSSSSQDNNTNTNNSNNNNNSSSNNNSNIHSKNRNNNDDNNNNNINTPKTAKANGQLQPEEQQLTITCNRNNNKERRRREQHHHANHNNHRRGKKKNGILKFDPFRSTYEWRRVPVPARFMGSKDHIELKDISATKIFLNMSVTEVLCTTTAEAIAMQKFVIIPKHASNEFFYQFPNCLAYESLEECYEKLLWALERQPESLQEHHRYLLSWEGATERLLQSAVLTQKEVDVYRLCGNKKNDKHAARFHIESGKKGQFLGKMLFGI